MVSIVGKRQEKTNIKAEKPKIHIKIEKGGRRSGRVDPATGGSPNEQRFVAKFEIALTQ
jgi:hypothetical protein